MSNSAGFVSRGRPLPPVAGRSSPTVALQSYARLSEPSAPLVEQGCFDAVQPPLNLVDKFKVSPLGKFINFVKLNEDSNTVLEINPRGLDYSQGELDSVTQTLLGPNEMPSELKVKSPIFSLKLE